MKWIIGKNGLIPMVFIFSYIVFFFTEFLEFTKPISENCNIASYDIMDIALMYVINQPNCVHTNFTQLIKTKWSQT